MPRTHALLMATVLLITLLLAGCTQTNTQTNPLTTLVNKANQITTISYEMTTSMTTGNSSINMTAHFWQKPHYMKKQQQYADNRTTILISTPNGTYEYDPQTHTWRNSTQIVTPMTSNYTAQMLATTHLTQIGNDTLDGKQTTIVQYTTPINKTDATVRIWLWNDNGLPLKIITTITFIGQTITTTTLLTDISFDVSDDVFALS